MTFDATGWSGYGGVTIHQVDPGTEIQHKGERLVVENGNGVHLGGALYLTPSDCRALIKYLRNP